MARNLEIIPPSNVRLQDIGELLVAAVAAAVRFPLLILAFRRGSTQFRKVSLDLSLFLSLLIVFGITVNLLHLRAGNPGWFLHERLLYPRSQHSS